MSADVLGRTQEYEGRVIDALSRRAGCPEAVGYFRPLTADDVETAGCEIDPRWKWPEWWYSPENPGDGCETVAWREGDAVFVPGDATNGASCWYAEGPKAEDRWFLAEAPERPVIVMPEGESRRTLAVVM